MLKESEEKYCAFIVDINSLHCGPHCRHRVFTLWMIL